MDSTSDVDRDARRMTVLPGETFPIRLWEDRTRGEEWVPAYDPAALALVTDDYLRTVSGNAVDAGRRQFEFRAVREGVHRLVFEKRMGWKFTAEDRRVFLIQVAGKARDIHA
jgi:predicted secreted protein